MPTLHLTDVAVRSLKGSGAYVTYWDDATPAFGVRVGKRTKTWTVMRGAARERVSFGAYPDMSLAEARAEAKRLLCAEAGPRAVAIKFAAAREQFLDENYKGKSPRTRYQVGRALKRHFKGFEGKDLGDIGDADIDAAFRKIAHTPSEQLHAFRYLRTFFRWCTRPPRRYLRHSPMEGFQPPSADRRRQRFLSDDEIVAVWNAVQTPQEACVRLILLWGTRRGETAALERSWRARDVLTIPGEHTKNGRPHAIPICPLAERTLPDHNYGHIFHGRWGEGPVTPRGLSQIVATVQARSGTSGWTPHDLRRTFRSLAARVGVSREIAEKLLNHAPKTLDEIYDRYSYLDEKRAALAKIEAGLVWLLARD
jgi:integrase